MKFCNMYVLTLLMIAFIAHKSLAQSVGIGTDNPNPNAVLELISPDNNQGLLVPKMTTAQRIATSFVSGLSSTENGLLVYDIDESTFYYWDANDWSPLKTSIVDTSVLSASEIPVNAVSGIEATDVQSALVELQNEISTSTGVQIGDNSVGTSALIDEAVTNEKVASVAFGKITDVPTGLSDGDDDTQLTDIEIAAMGYVKTAGTDDQLANEVAFTPGGDLVATDVQSALIELDSKVTDAASAAIPDNAITTVKLSNGSVTTPKLSDAAVTTIKISDNAVTDAKITSIDYSKITGLPTNLDTDATDDFDGEFSSLNNIPSDLSDGDDDTQLTDAQIAAMGYVKTGGTDDQVASEVDFTIGGNITSDNVQDALIELDGRVTAAASASIPDGAVTTPKISNGAVTNVKITSVDYSKITGLPTNLDTDATDDFDGDFTSLSNIPSGLSDGDDDTQLTDAGIAAMGYIKPSDLPVNLDTDATDDFDGDFTSLSNIPSGLSDGDDDTQLTEAEVDAMVADNGYLTSEGDGSTTNEIQNLYRSGNTLGLTGDATTVDLSIYLNTDTNTQLSETQVDNYVSDNGYVENTVTTFTITGGGESIDASSRILEVSATATERGIVDVKANPDVIEIMVANTGGQMIRIYHNVSNIFFADGSNYDLQPYAALHLYYSAKLSGWIQVGSK